MPALVQPLLARSRVCPDGAAARAGTGPQAALSCAGLRAGARGPLAEEEARLFQLRKEAEGEVRQELQRARMELEVRAWRLWLLDVLASGRSTAVLLSGWLPAGVKKCLSCLPNESHTTRAKKQCLHTVIKLHSSDASFD